MTGLVSMSALVIVVVIIGVIGVGVLVVIVLRVAVIVIDLDRSARVVMGPERAVGGLMMQRQRFEPDDPQRAEEQRVQSVT